MSLVFYDTYHKRKMDFKSLHEGEVRIYNCGPTVYGYAHIGNHRANMFADLLRRWLENSGFTVHQVMNITDVDDKTIRDSQKSGVSLAEFTGSFTKAFFEDLESLNILRAEVYPTATGHIEEMVSLVERLIENGHAYRTEDGSIYFRVASFPDYGKLSGKRIEDLQIGERVSSDEYESKDDVRDFALWKSWDEADGDVFWETSLGKGRPGWHIECSAMSMKYHGPEFDIHTGGVDNIFPHHENEIAQSHCATGGKFAHWWLHCEYLIVEGKKMSKSLGNFFTLRDLMEMGYKPREIRYVLIGTHYRSQLNFTLEGLKAARSSLKRLDEFRDSWQYFPEGDATEGVKRALERAHKTFQASMDDDLNVSPALAAIFNLLREINGMAEKGQTTSGDNESLEQAWCEWDHALGFLLPNEDFEPADADREWIEAKISERAAAREAKDWSRADAIRDELLQKGIELKDSADGTRWQLK